MGNNPAINDALAYKNAMANIRDMSIDPDTGKVTKYTNKSILKENGKDGNKDVEKKLSFNKDESKVSNSIANVYREMMKMPSKQIVSEDVEVQPEKLDVGPKLSDDYIKSLVKGMKKNKR